MNRLPSGVAKTKIELGDGARKIGSLSFFPALIPRSARRFFSSPLGACSQASRREERAGNT